jgi:hypothetical protein
MDDMKRAMYLRAREIIAGKLKNRVDYTDPTHSYTYVCTALRAAFREETGFQPGLTIQPLGAFVQEFFPEFVELYDGCHWTRGELHRDHDDMPPELTDEPTDIDSAWWESGWAEPRLRLIDYILST